VGDGRLCLEVGQKIMEQYKKVQPGIRSKGNLPCAKCRTRFALSLSPASR
jgi:hypothetical protein